MAYLKYGTADYYAEAFSDFLADVDASQPETAENMLEGFYRALDSWFDYHTEQANAYSQLRQRVREALTV